MSVTGRGVPILVSGMVGAVPGQGGATWAVLQYVHGLRELGYDPVLVEPIARPAMTPEIERYYRRIGDDEGLGGRVAILHGAGDSRGLPWADLIELASRAPAMLNLAGTLREPELIERIPVRVYVDLDPAFTQLWQAVDGIDMGLDGHTHYATVGLEVGRAGCDVPTLDIDWIPTLPPVCLGRWPVSGTHADEAWTTIANWRGYGSIRHGTRFYGQKAHAFRDVMELPSRTTAPFLVALSIHPDEVEDLSALASNGWTVVDPRDVASTPDRYRRFVCDSYAEIGIAKHGYVSSGCGWFSDRSACYLAAGKPVLASDTGFSRHLPTGRGLLGFTTLDEASAGVEAIRRDYDRHAGYAREIAEAHLDAGRVLTGLLSRVGVA